ncbi:MAG: T9SS type A sorting domain-containing protein [Candidatus Kapabacteria bacterium]|nr:T9SS type A sorting domain-containing protein [Candidatus Kapabacteria bacterium]
MQRLQHILTGMAALIMMFVATAVKAAAPNAPVEFSAKVTYPTGAAPVVVLMWYEAREGDKATEFQIFRAEGQTEDLTKFTKIATVPARDGERGKYTWDTRDIAAGTYTFFVRAINADGESNRTVIKVLTITTQERRILFVTKAANVGWVNTAYEYQARAEANFDGKVIYALVSGPDGMTCSETGLVTWTPTRVGRFEVKIKAWVQGTDIVTDQAWVIEVTEKNNGGGGEKGDFCAWIGGRVKYDDGTPVMNGWVMAWRVDRAADDKGNPTETWRPVHRVQMVQGIYKLNVAAGTYKIRIEGEGYYAEWYKDVESADAAEVMTVACDKTYEVPLVVTPVAKPVMRTIKGRVTDATTGEGLKAIVTFESTSRDASKESKYRVLRAETNAEGYYTIALPEGQTYIAVASVPGSEGKKQLYSSEFWEETSDPTKATKITVSEDKEGVNFTLEKRAVRDNGFGGTMKSNDDPTIGVPGKVVAYLIVERTKDGKEVEPGKEKAAVVETDANGNYRFSDVEPGTYIVFGIPASRPYAPGYFVQGVVAATEWKNATRIQVGEAMATVQYDIMVKKTTEKRGMARVRGWVYRKAGSVVRGEQMPEVTVGGAYIVVTDAAGELVDFALADEAGTYEILDLGIGTQTLYADRIGFLPATRTLTVDAAANAEQEVSMELTPSVVSTVEIPVDLSTTSYNLFPNPAQGAATLQFPSTPGTATVSILTASGSVVSTQQHDVAGGLVRTELNTTGLAAGMYLVRVSNGTATFALPLTVLR